MRGLGLLTIMAAVGLMLTASVREAEALDVQNIAITYGLNRIDDVTKAWCINVNVQGTGITHVVLRNESTNEFFSLTPVGGNLWQYNGCHLSLASFQAHHQNPVNYRLWFNQLAPGIYADQVLLGYNMTAPTGYANITTPGHDSGGNPPSPVVLWDSVNGFGHFQNRMLIDGSANILMGVPLDSDMTHTSWSPGIVLDPTDEPFWVRVGVVRNHTGQPGQGQVLQTLHGDVFGYFAQYEDANANRFSLSTGEVPEPVSIMLFGTAILALIGYRRRLHIRG